MASNISDHDHAMHKGPHHDKYIHEHNRMKGEMHKSMDGLQVKSDRKGEHELGDKSHLDSLKGEPHGADVAGHSGKMKW